MRAMNVVTNAQMTIVSVSRHQVRRFPSYALPKEPVDLTVRLPFINKKVGVGAQGRPRVPSRRAPARMNVPVKES